jgi:ABC-2 type transport system permease protein
VSQVTAVLEKIVKESVRDRVILFLTFAIPIFFVLIMPFMWGDAPQEVMPPLKGGLCLTMITFMMMVAGQSNLAGFIASDRERGLYFRIISMPVSPLKEAVGRVLGIVLFSVIGAVLVLVVGVLYGAQFTGGAVRIVESLGFFVLIMVAATGIGLIIASVVKGESAATHTGIALTLLTAFMGGMFAPYAMLPSFLQVVARIHPIASANAGIVFLLQGESVSYYNPLTQWQVALTIVGSCTLLVVGLILYSKLCWRRR